MFHNMYSKYNITHEYKFPAILRMGIFGLVKNSQVVYPVAALSKLQLRGILFASLVYLGGFTFTSAAYGANYYVATTGSDLNQGTVSDPWLTIQKCLNMAAAGDTCNVASGTYAADFETVRNGSQGSFITVSGAGETQTIITGQLTVTHAYHVFSNLRFRDHYVNVQDSGANHNLFEHNEFTANTQGIYMHDDSGTNDGNGGPAYNIIRYNTFYQPVGNGMVALLGHHNEVTNNIFRDNNGYDALRVWGHDQTIESNEFLDFITGVEAGHSNHVDIIQSFNTSNLYAAKDIVFERNHIVNNHGQLGNLENAGGVADMGNWIFRNNLLVNSRIQLNNSLPHVKIYNNTIYNVPVANPVGFRFAFVDESEKADYGEVYNNIFIGDGGNYSFNASTIGCVADNNLLSDLSGNVVSAPNEGTHGINGGFDPDDVFINIIAGNFQLNNTSPAIDAGLNLSANFSDDYLGNIRSGAWDIGAYEYQSGSDTTSPANPSGLSVS